MGQNLTGKLVSATYEDLVQISGSILTNGLGTDITSITVTSSFASQAGTAGFASQAGTSGYASTSLSASYALTASYAENIPANTGFPYTGSAEITGSLSVTGSIAVQSGSYDGFVIDNLTTPTASEALEHIVVISQADFNAIAVPDPNTFYIINDATGSIVVEDLIVSGSLQVTGSAAFANGITGSLFGTASFATTASATPNAIVTASLFNTNNNILFEKGDGSTFELFIDDVPSAGFAFNATNAATASLANTASIALDLDAAAQISISSISASNATFVSASIGYLTAVTGSVTKIGDAFILLNTSDVTRYAGLLVEDSGSSTPINYTASFFFDSETNDWNYEYTSGSTDYGVALFGPTYSTKGVPTYLTANTLPKAEGTHHLVDSIISDDGSVVTVSGNVEATAITASAGFSGDLAGTSSFATSASYATNALSSSYALTASFAENVVPQDTGSLLVTASISDATITFTKGDASTFDITVNNVSNADSASYATNADKVYISASSEAAILPVILGGPSDLDNYTDARVDVGANLGYDPSTSILYSPTFSGNLSGNADTATTASYAATALSSSYALTASYAENAGSGGFPYTGSAAISGSLRVLVSGSADGYTITSGSLTGSLIDNLGTPTGSEAIKHLVYLSQAEYNAITPDGNTMYVISGSGDVVENLIVSSSLEVSGSTVLTGSLSVTTSTALSGSLVVSGSTTITGSLVGNVSALSISSNTASMDLNTGNFFTLQLVSGSNTYINPTNIKAGQTINLLVSTTGSATVSFPSSVKQVSGSSYVPTTTTSKDVVTFIAFDNTSLYLSNVKNLV